MHVELDHAADTPFLVPEVPGRQDPSTTLDDQPRPWARVASPPPTSAPSPLPRRRRRTGVRPPRGPKPRVPRTADTPAATQGRNVRAAPRGTSPPPPRFLPPRPATSSLPPAHAAWRSPSTPESRWLPPLRSSCWCGSPAGPGVRPRFRCHPSRSRRSPTRPRRPGRGTTRRRDSRWSSRSCRCRRPRWAPFRP